MMKISRLGLWPILILLTACQTMATDETDAGARKTLHSTIDKTPIECLAFLPITWSRNDTERTREQVIAHNAAWDALCKGAN